MVKMFNYSLELKLTPKIDTKYDPKRALILKLEELQIKFAS